MKDSIKVYWFLVLIFAICSAISIFLPQGNFISEKPLPAPKPIIALVVFIFIFLIYGGLGFLGLILSKKLNFTDMLDKNISNKKRFLLPLLLGIIFGIIIIMLDLLFSNFNSVGKLIHPPFPTSLSASISAGIGEEIIFRLFFITFWVWLISLVLLKGRYKNQIFWIITIISALIFSLAHIPSLMILFNFKSISDIPTMLLLEIILMNSLISIPAAYYFRKYGFLTAIGIHFWTDIIWHFLYPLL